MKKKWNVCCIVLFAVLMTFAMTACASPQRQEKKKEELVVFAASSMTETLTEIADLFCEAEPDVTITYNFDSSGTLKTQIQEGAECDVFISAAQKQMDQLDVENRLNLVENKVVLAVAEENPAGIASFQDLATEKVQLIGLGNKDVPVGAYSEKILTYLGVKETLEENGKITYGSNVKEVTTQIVEGSVDCGIIYATDARAAGLKIVDAASEEMCGQVLYPAAVMANSKRTELAREFLEFLKREDCSAVFERAGFEAIDN